MFIYALIGVLFVQVSQAVENSFASADATATINVTHSGECSNAYLDLRGVRLDKYQAAISFDTKRIRIEPERPVIPGCMTVVAEVEVHTRLKDVTAQIELRLTGVPDPSVPTIPCGKREKKQDHCSCGQQAETCTFCGFCRNLQRKELREISIQKNVSSRRKSNIRLAGADNTCGCGPVEPGTYTLSAEVCTPEAEELKEDAPIEIQQRIAEGKPLPLFISVQLYNFHFDDSPRLLSPLGKLIFLRRKATGTIGCYLVGANVFIDGSKFENV